VFGTTGPKSPGTEKVSKIQSNNIKLTRSQQRVLTVMMPLVMPVVNYYTLFTSLYFTIKNTEKMLTTTTHTAVLQLYGLCPGQPG